MIMDLLVVDLLKQSLAKRIPGILKMLSLSAR